jgi:DNA-binding XRE family transcriptional regulator
MQFCKVMTVQIWQKSDGEKLKQLRNAANINSADMARWAAISTNQLHQLEDGGDSSFYSQQIKYNMGSKLLKLFGDSPGELESGNSNINRNTNSHTNISDQGQEPNASTKWSITVHNFWTHYKVALVAFIFFAFAISLDVYYTTFKKDVAPEQPNKATISTKDERPLETLNPASAPFPAQSAASEATDDKKAP